MDRRDINGQGSSPPHCVQWGTIGNNLNVSHYGHGEIWALLYSDKGLESVGHTVNSE